MGADKKRHHYVPASLSRGFTADGERELYLYDVKEGRIVSASPKDVFAVRELHTIQREHGIEDRNFVEDYLMDFEDKGVVALRKFISARILSDEDRSNVAMFWALQLVRTPVVRAGVSEFL